MRKGRIEITHVRFCCQVASIYHGLAPDLPMQPSDDTEDSFVLLITARRWPAMVGGQKVTIRRACNDAPELAQAP